ncbi:MAG: glycoside hydrolase family 3 C-terminal domain-containing protein [Prevotellaceae bacterium]|nr:glycoside hydrolase family 3 C-terminal domain-containing protein [Prevotellaceae bacterium]
MKLLSKRAAALACLFPLVFAGFSRKTMYERAIILKDRFTIEEKIDLLCAGAPAIPRLKVPAYDWWSECPSGVARAGKATVFPCALSLSCTWDMTLIKRVGAAIGDEARAKYQAALRENGYTGRYEGLTFLSPSLTLVRDPRQARVSDCFGEDPYLAGEAGVAFIRGLQGDDPVYLKTVAAPGRFVVAGAGAGGSEAATIDEVSLREYYFPPFRKAAEKGRAASFVVSGNALNGVPSSASAFLLTDVLRGEWGFEGAVVSDVEGVSDIYSRHGFAPGYEAAAADALKAGCDMALSDEYRDGLRYALRNQLVSRADIDRAAVRAFELRLRLGMFDPPENFRFAQIPEQIVESALHGRLAVEAARKAIVMLKNRSVLPIDRSKVRKIALIGRAFKRVRREGAGGLPEYEQSLFELLASELGDTAELVAVDEGEVEETVPSEVLLSGSGKGLRGEYFDVQDFDSPPALTRAEPALDLNPATDSQLRKLHGLSARWSGTLLPPVSGEYILKYEGAGAVKIFVDGQLVVDEKLTEGVTVKRTMALSAGNKRELRIESADMNPRGRYRLSWKLPADKNAPTPAKVAKEADMAILFLRDDFDKADRNRERLDSNPEWDRLTDEVYRANANTVVIAGGAGLPPLRKTANNCRALLYAGRAGRGEAQALADILVGKTTPSGKLSVTLVEDEKQLPAFDDYDVKSGRGYGYFSGNVLYPFGFGLSYTEYAYGKPELKYRKIQRNGMIVVAVKVSNKGLYDGEEVIQCYVSSKLWKKNGPKRKLVAFDRVFLKKGASDVFEFRIPATELQRWSTETRQWEIQPGEYEISVVSNSGEKNSATFTIL